MYPNLLYAKDDRNQEEKAPFSVEFEWQWGNRTYTSEQIEVQSAMKKCKVDYLDAE